MFYSAQGMAHRAILLVVLFCTSTFPIFAQVNFDYNGDEKADVVLRRPSDFSFINYRTNNQEILGLRGTDIPVAGDFDGDGIFDVAVRRPSNAMWYIQNSTDSSAAGIQRIKFGLQSTDIPVTGDYDGDGITDVAVRRPSNYMWYILNSSGGANNSNDAIQRVQFGKNSADIPVPADYNGDGITDIAVRRPSNSTWYILNSQGDRVNYNAPRNDGIQRIKFGLQSTDIPVPADYDGDGIDDIAVRRPSNSMWYIKSSLSGEIIRIRFGLQADDIPMVADYDGDGKADPAVRRVSDNHVYIRRSSDNRIERIEAGLEIDIPIASPMSVIMAMVEGSPVNRDSDNDGLNDYEEQVHGSDPTAADTDGDGLSDYEEVNTYETNPTLADTDNDGVNDGEEVQQGSNPNTVINATLAEFVVEDTIILDWPESMVSEGFFPNYLTVLDFAEDGSLLSYVSAAHGTPEPQSLSWSADTEGDITVTGFEAEQQYFTSWHPYNEVRETWGDEAADNLLIAYDQGYIDYYFSTYIETQVAQQHYQAIGSTEGGYGLLKTTYTLQTLLVPDSVKEQFGEEAFVLSSNTQESHVMRHLQEHHREQWSNLNQSVTWALPLYYSLEETGTLLNTYVGPGFRHDLITFNDDVVNSEVSAMTFTWGIDSSELTLTNDQGTHSYWILKTRDNESLVAVRFVNNEDEEFWFTSTLQTYHAQDLDIEAALLTALPEIKASHAFGWNSERYFSDNVPRAPYLFGYQFLSDGTLQRGIYIEEGDTYIEGDTEYREEILNFGAEWQYQIDENAGTVTMEYYHRNIIRQRVWRILGVDNQNRMSYLEYSWYSDDSNYNGELDEDERKYFVQPRINYHKSVDLSAYGDLWGNLDLDDDGLTNAQESEAGTSFTEADSDSDGLSDYDEVITHGTNPLVADSDNDGLTDSEELLRGTDPNTPDTGNFEEADVLNQTLLFTALEEDIQSGYVPLLGEVYEFQEDGAVTYHRTAQQGSSEALELTWSVDDSGYIAVSGFDSFSTAGYYNEYYYPFDALEEQWGTELAEQLREAYFDNAIGYSIYIYHSQGTYAHFLGKQEEADADNVTERMIVRYEGIEIPQNIIDAVNQYGQGWQGDSKYYVFEHSSTSGGLLQDIQGIEFQPFDETMMQSQWALAHSYTLESYFSNSDSATAALYWDLFDFTDATAQSQIAGLSYDWAISSDGALQLSNEDVTLTYRLIMQNENEYYTLAEVEADGVSQFIVGNMVRASANAASFTDNLLTEIPEIYTSTVNGWRKDNWDAGVYSASSLFGYQFVDAENLKRGIYIDDYNNEHTPSIHFGYDWTYSVASEARQVVMYRPENRGYRTWDILGVDSNGKTLVLERSIYQYDANSNGEIDDDEKGYFVLPRISMLEKADLSQYEAWGNTDFDDDGLTLNEETQYGTDPENPDSDGDGVSDGDEVEAGYDPNTADNFVDFELFGDDSLAFCIQEVAGQAFATVESVTELDCFDYSNISTLAGIEQLINLQRLVLLQATADDFSVLAQLSHLTELLILDSEIGDLSFLSEMTQLQRLSLQYSRVDDFAAIADLSSLQWLSLSNTSFIDLQTLEGLQSLTTLHLRFTAIEDFQPLGNLTSIQYLNLSGTSFSDGEVLSPLTQLETLLLVDVSTVTDFAPILALPALTGLDLSGTSIDNFAVFGTRDNWKLIGAGGIALTTDDLSFLAQQTALETLWLNDSGLSSVADVSALISHLPIIALDLSDNDITDLTGIEALSTLERLYLYFNNIQDITPLYSLPALQRVILSYNYGLYCWDLEQLHLTTGADVIYHNCRFESSALKPQSAASKTAITSDWTEFLQQRDEALQKGQASYRTLLDHW
ncbi:FG-GAP-like repeat-containing protein [Planctobacterium marinum]|uniref:Internalin n=1 Tax=Planctobacterium marinum TaxID=1631968 RepID=A0AA48KR44_9ALTE|nr:hypothetical protein MACH26_39820 [Planctobacterium marinum]